MAILELDKIIIKKPETGIHCANCGGDLRKIGRIKIIQQIVVFIGFRKLAGHKYECDNCKKKYTVI